VTDQEAFLVSNAGGIPVVALSGDVDITNVDAVRDAIGRAVVENTGMVLSLRDLNYLDSSMIYELFSLSKRFAQHRLQLALVWPASASARYILETAGIAKLASVFETRDEAIAAIRRKDAGAS